MEFSRGNTAECDAPDPVLVCQFQTGAVAGRKQSLILFADPVIDDRSDRVEDIAAREVKSRCDLRTPGWFLMPLFFHQIRAAEAQGDPALRMDHIVNAAVVWYVASGHSAVCRIDDRITSKRRDISLPDIKSIPDRRQTVSVRDALFPDLFLQICVLDL